MFDCVVFERSIAYVGKWHMQNQKERPGFDYHASYTGQGKYDDWFFLVDGVRTATKGWVDDVATDFAIDFMKRDRVEPFALTLGYKTPHIPFIPPARAKERYLGEKLRPAPLPEPEGEEAAEEAAE